MTITDSPNPSSLGDVKGWFPVIDQRVFGWLLERQAEQGIRGDLLELGSYLGKSAILIGRYLGDTESFTVCDLFGADVSDVETKQEIGTAYPTLTRDAFERNYLAFHERLPTIVQAPSSAIAKLVRPHSCRFIHVDASHLYKNVRGDIAAARTLLVEDGIVVCDDYRSEHTPGVAAAVWEAVFRAELQPICATRAKLYGTWGDPEPVREALLAWLGSSGIGYDVQSVAGHRFIRIKDPAASRNDSAAAKEVARLKRELAAAQAEVADLRVALRRIRRSRTFRIARRLSQVVRGLGRHR